MVESKDVGNRKIKHGTLVITKLSRFGVVMVADTAVTLDGCRSFVGYQKLFPVPQINAGISIWGNLDMPTESQTRNVDEFIRRFIMSISNEMNLWDMANRLTNELNNIFGNFLIENDLRMGIHVAGFDSRNGVRGPALYAINNGDYKIMMSEELGFVDVAIDSTPDNLILYPPVRRFEIDDIPPRVYEGNQQEGRKNGDFAIYHYLFDECVPIFNGLQHYNFIFPYPMSLEIIGEYYRFWVNFIKEIYRLSSENERIYGSIPPTIDYMHIGGPVSVLTISDTRINSFYTI